MDIRTIVHEALTAAVDENGHVELLKWSPEEIAIDLGTYCQELEGMDPNALEPHIIDWFHEREARMMD